MNKIANYDTLDYDYSTYWDKREYENKSEHILLNNIFSKQKGYWFIDVGGSYGRLTDTYYNQYKKPIIIDYSLKTLQKNREHLLNKYPNIELVAANAYKLPFKDNAFDGGLMVRVLHHINEPETYFREIHRVLNDSSTYVQEFANKIHILARIRALVKGDFDIFNQDPYQQPDKDNHEGAKKGSKVPFLNFHPKWVKEKLNEYDLKVTSKHGCSYLRNQTLKKIFGTELLIFFEKIFQLLLPWSNISPSIFYLTKVEKHVKTEGNMKLDSILCCPECHGDLNISSTKATCNKCKKVYTKENNIWDFRI